MSGSHNEFKAKAPGVVTGRYGTLGEVYYIEQDYWPLNTSLYVQDFKGNDPRFVSYYLRILLSDDLNSAGAVPGVNRNALHKLRIPSPPTERKKIAAVLAAYDDLIDNSTRRIELLERMSEQLYREWFVRMRFPGHEGTEIVKGVPQGWETRKLPEVAQITYGFAFQSSKFNTEGEGKTIVRIRNIPTSSSSDYTDEVAADKYLIRNGDLIVGMDGIFHINHWQGEEAYLVQRVCRIKARHPVMEGYLGWAVRAPIKHFESILQGATLAHLGAKHLKTIDILIPPKSMEPHLERFKELVAQKLMLSKQVQQLEAIRDLLLPRLISGKLSVEDLDIQFPPSMRDDDDGNRSADEPTASQAELFHA